jgi:hypothetical protein
MNFGADHKDVMGALERFAVHVMPHFKNQPSSRAKELA